MFKSIFVTALMLFGVHISYAQQYSLSGSIRDSKNNHPLTGATIEVEGAKNFAISDELGRFTVTRLKEGTHNLIVRFLGFAVKTETVSIPSQDQISILLEETALLTDEVLVYSTRARENMPTTFSTVDKQVIAKQNFGQDLPYLLNWTPSLVTTSDAGTGIGYTGLRIRGSDATSINVTINGIPYNDSESLGTFWVDVPDIASSSESIQIQRGVGSSTNGAGAFGGTINLQTITRADQPYATLTNSAGFLGNGVSDLNYNSRRHTLGFGTGLFNKHWIVDGRFSKIASEGFIDRATADLGSYYLSAGFYAGNTMVKGIAFGGKERTYQAWYGVPESRLNDDQEAMLVTASNEYWNEEQTRNLLSSDSRTFNPYTYKNQVDDYRQDHYQLHFSQRFSGSLTGNVALHYTPGKGYYEEFKPDDSFSKYGLEPIVIGDSLIESSDLVRRRWLDNDFSGLTFSINHVAENLDFTFGGGYNHYAGKHFGEIIWAEVSPVPNEFKYYNNSSDKYDLNLYAKVNYQFTQQLNGYLDLQGRRIDYDARGLDNGGGLLDINKHFNFFNPKAGLVYQINSSKQLYGSFSVANREPVRSDFINAPQDKEPKHETLRNLELGYRMQKEKFMLHTNYYFMNYKNQLIHTGKINDVGAPIRTNVDKSYRMGLELEALAELNSKFLLNANATYSLNKIKNFTEVLYDYGAEWADFIQVERNYKNTDIAFSPTIIAGLGLTYKPINGFEVAWLSKYVSRQYLDNTSSRSRSLDPYFVNDLRLSYSIKPSFAKEITVSLLANNILNERFESNGYSWGFLGGGAEYRENYYYPQAGRNYLAMLAVRF